MFLFEDVDCILNLILSLNIINKGLNPYIMEDYGLEELSFLDGNLKEYYKTKTLFLDLPKRNYNIFGKLYEIRGDYLTFENCFNTTIKKDYLLEKKGNLEFELGEEILPMIKKATYHKNDISSIIVYHKGSTYKKDLN